MIVCFWCKESCVCLTVQRGQYQVSLIHLFWTLARVYPWGRDKQEVTAPDRNKQTKITKDSQTIIYIAMCQDPRIFHYFFYRFMPATTTFIYLLLWVTTQIQIMYGDNLVIKNLLLNIWFVILSQIVLIISWFNFKNHLKENK